MPICVRVKYVNGQSSRDIIRYNYNGDARYRDTILAERSRSILTMILDLEIGATVLSDKQNEINKTSKRSHAPHLRPPRIDVTRIILSVCLRSAARVNIFQRVCFSSGERKRRPSRTLL